MKSQVRDSKESRDAEARAVANETLLQLEAAKKTVESLRFHEAKTDEMAALRDEVARLRSALEAAYEEKSSFVKTTDHSTKQQREAADQVLEAELKQAKACIEELRAELMDKETELQGISEENEGLTVKLKKIETYHDNNNNNNNEREIVVVGDVKASLRDKEMELQKVLEENKALRMEISERVPEGEVAMKRLEAAKGEMEAELRRVKVQCDQWRKAAEAAVSMLWAGSDGRPMERSKSKYCGTGSSYGEEMVDGDDDDVLLKKKKKKKKKKIGVMWKKQQK